MGILESLWHFAQEYARDGAVGRHPDEAIARWIGWTGNPVDLIHGLATAGWIDRCSCHRLRIHDWPKHADQTVKRVLAEHDQWFLACYDDPGAVLAPSELPCRAVPSLAKPGQPSVSEPPPTPATPAEARNVALGKLGPPKREDEAREVHVHWLAVMGKRATTKLLPERREKILARLREGYTVEQLKQAIDGCRVSPFHRGGNDKRQVYDDLMLICRSGSKVEMFIGLHQQHTKPAEPDHGLPTAGPWERPT